MVKPVAKTLSGAYGSAILGLLLGIVGMQRYYLRHYISATVMTLIFVGGLFLLTFEIILKYYSLLDQLTSSLSALSSGNGQFGNVPQIDTVLQTSNNLNLYLGYVCCAVGGGWWVLDLFLLPKMVREYNE
ncbi:MAG: hypothetical protein K0U19_03395 [Proteobacteria bacterium]|nr:hypothetical protein [Pseudomonadota bacterium]